MTYKKFKQIQRHMIIYKQNDNCHRENCFKYKCKNCPDNIKNRGGSDGKK
jgi:hypothetical protein